MFKNIDAVKKRTQSIHVVLVYIMITCGLTMKINIKKMTLSQ